MTSQPLALSPIVAGLWRITGWNLGVAERVRWIEQALELGITTFDLADIYGDYEAEGHVGDALKARPALRQRMQLVTKCGIRLRSAQRPYRINYYDSSAAYVRARMSALCPPAHVHPPVVRTLSTGLGALLVSVVAAGVLMAAVIALALRAPGGTTDLLERVVAVALTLSWLGGLFVGAGFLRRVA